MAVSGISNSSWSSFFQTTGKYAAIGGSVVSVAYVLLGQDYTYPFAIAVIGACAWLGVRLNQSIPQEVLRPIPQEALRPSASERPLVEAKEIAHEFVDRLGAKFSQEAKVSTGQLVDLGIATGKVAVIATLPLGVQTVAGASLDIAGESIKGLSAKSVDASTGCTLRAAHKSVNRSFT